MSSGQRQNSSGPSQIRNPVIWHHQPHDRDIQVRDHPQGQAPDADALQHRSVFTQTLDNPDAPDPHPEEKQGEQVKTKQGERNPMLPLYPVLGEDLPYTAMSIDINDALNLLHVRRLRYHEAKPEPIQIEAEKDTVHHKGDRKQTPCPPQQSLLLPLAKQQKQSPGKRVGQKNVAGPDEDSVNQPERSKRQQATGIEAHEAHATRFRPAQLDGKTETEQERKESYEFALNKGIDECLSNLVGVAMKKDPDIFVNIKRRKECAHIRGQNSEQCCATQNVNEENSFGDTYRGSTLGITWHGCPDYKSVRAASLQQIQLLFGKVGII